MTTGKGSADENIDYIRERTLRKFPLLGVTMSGLKVYADEKIGTAATNGEEVIYSPSFFNSLPEDQQVFVFAHEVFHAAFNHISRSKGKNPGLWNTATDAVINQILQKEGLPLVNGGVDMPEALNCSAEEMYEKLLKQEQEKEQNQSGQGDNQPEQNGGQQNQEQQQGQSEEGESSSQEQIGHDNHQIWKDAVERAEKKRQEQEEKKNGRGQGLLDKLKDLLKKKEESSGAQEPSSQEYHGEDDSSSRREGCESEFEKSFGEQNRQLRQEKAEQVRQALERRKNEMMKTQADGHCFGAVGEAKAIADWKKLLKKSIEEEEDRWSYRRSGAENDYMARVEELEDEGRAETEVMLDVSGSVDVVLLKEFLRQLKPLLKNSKLKVGCFDEYFYGLKEIKSNKDIDNFQVTAKSQWTENWDLAVRSFSQKKEVNKIVFTDGYPAPGTMPKDDLRHVNVIWLVYGNKSFNPVCGKVIQVDKKQITQKFLSAAAMSRGAER